MTAAVILNAPDAPGMAALHRVAFPEGEAWTRESFADLLALPTTLALGIEAEIGLSAMIVLQVTPDTAEILTIGVVPHHRRRGLASDLLRASRTLLGQRGVAQLLLDVAADNSAAINFYKAQGFTQDNIRKSYYKRLDGSRIDAMLMSSPVAGQRP